MKMYIYVHLITTITIRFLEWMIPTLSLFIIDSLVERLVLGINSIMEIFILID